MGTEKGAGREQGFRLLYEDHVARVARYAARRTAPNDVQDVVSETFLTAWRRFDELPADTVPWLFATARNVISNRRRSSERRRALGDRLAAEPAWASDPGSPADARGVDRRLLAAIAALPGAEREAFMLTAWDGLDAVRASRAAGCSAATFRMRLHRARRRLRRAIAPHATASPADVPTLEDTR